MILDKLENSAIYSGINQNLKKGFEFLQNQDLKSLEVGKYEIDGADVFALVSEYDTKEHQNCKPEAHQVYTDIQFIVSGKEYIGFETLAGQEVTTPYNPEKDIVFYNCNSTPLLLEAGMFAVFFPQDVHQPCMQVSSPEKVKKVVVKVKL